MVEGRRPRGRVLLLLSLLLAAALAWSGCAGSPPSTGGGGAGGSEDEDDDAGPLGPYAGMVAGVDAVALPAADAPGGITGFVYDVTSGEGLAGVLVAVECVVLAVGPSTVSRELVTGDGGVFVVGTALELSHCTALRYEVDAAGYRLVVPLESGPITEGVQYVVKAGMVSDLP